MRLTPPFKPSRSRPLTLAGTKRAPRVFHKDAEDCPPGARYIGRGSGYGNPFVIGHYWAAKKRRMTRADVIERFKCEVLPNLDVSALRGCDLACHCKPLDCHGDPILEKANG